MRATSDRAAPGPRAGDALRRVRRRVAVAVLATSVALASVGCIGRLGRNDDDVTPESDRPSANKSLRFEVPDPLSGSRR